MADAQAAYTAIVRHLIHTGRAPHYTELAGILSVSPDQARELQREAANASIGCWLAEGTDYIESWAPFSNLPTQYLLTIRGKQKWYGQ